MSERGVPVTNPFVGITYAEALRSIERRHGPREALYFRGRRYTFSDVRREVDRASARLATLGLEPGDKVAIWMPNRPEFIWYWLGASQMGLVAVFLNTRLRRDEFVYQIAQSDSRVIIVPGQPGFRDFLSELGEASAELRSGGLERGSPVFPALRHVVVCDPPSVDWPAITDWSQEDRDLPVPPVAGDPDRPALIAYSSGTTALPKGAMLTHAIWRKAYDGGNTLGLSPEDRLYLCVPLFGVLGSLNGVLTFWSHGASVVLEERFDATACLDALIAERCTAIHLLPAMISALLQNPRFDRRDLHRLRVGVVLSSDPVVLRQAALDLGVGGVVTGYGLTESTGLVTRCRWDEPLEDRLASQGRPLPGCLIRVVDPESGRDMPPDSPGEIWIGGYCVMPGYYNKPDETRRAITPDGWLRSGDAGLLRPDGTLVFQRRLGDGYKHKGFNVSVPEVEAVLGRHPNVRAGAIVSVPHPEFGEAGVAFVIPRAGTRPDGDELAAFLRARLASFKVPTYFHFVDALPLTGGTEKIQKFRLREQALALVRADAGAVSRQR